MRSFSSYKLFSGLFFLIAAQLTFPAWGTTVSLYCEGSNTVSIQTAPYKQGKKSTETDPPFKATRVLSIDTSREVIFEGTGRNRYLLSDGVSVSQTKFSVFTIRPIPEAKARGEEGTRLVAIDIDRVTGEIDYTTSYWHPGISGPSGEWLGRKDDFTGTCRPLENVKPKF